MGRANQPKAGTQLSGQDAWWGSLPWGWSSAEGGGEGGRTWPEEGGHLQLSPADRCQNFQAEPRKSL